MSCGQQGAEEDDNMAMPTATLMADHCLKCDKKPVIVVRTTSYCPDHFRDHLQFMYREGMNGPRNRSKQGSPHDTQQGKKRGLQRSKVVLAFSGGTSSRALLELLRQNFPTRDQIQARNPKNKAPPMFESLDVIYVDESGLPGFGPDRCLDIERIVQEAGFPLRRVKLEDAFRTLATTKSTTSPLRINVLDANLPTTSSAPITADPPSPLDQMRAMFSAELHSPTSLAALHTATLHALLRRTAVEMGAEILLLGSSATRLAVRTLSAMAEGGGYAMGEDVGVEYTLDQLQHDQDPDATAATRSLLVARPLGRVLYKELAYYARSQGLECLTMERPSTAVEPKAAGISALVEAFVLGLEENFPSTVSTIIRTAQKLGMRTEDARERGTEPAPLCPLCGLPAQEGAADWRKAITIDSLEEAKKLQANICSSSTVPETVDSSTRGITASTGKSASSTSDAFDVASLLCYSCLLVCQGTKRPSAGQKSRTAVAAVGEQGPAEQDEAALMPLPPYVIEAALARIQRQQRVVNAGHASEDIQGVRIKSDDEMKAEVDEYLL